MDTPIITNTPRVCLPRLKRLPRSPRPTINDDPARRLIAAVVLRAVRDVWFPDKYTTVDDTFDAAQFLASDDGNFLLAAAIGKAA